jgi:hypothetical protein
MVEISLSGSGEGSGWVTAPGYSTAAFSAPPILGILTSSLEGARSGRRCSYSSGVGLCRLSCFPLMRTYAHPRASTRTGAQGRVTRIPANS